MKRPATPDARGPTFDSDHFRKVLGHFPTGVTVITGISAAGAPVGLTVGSFASVSLDPPLVGFFPAISSTTWPEIATSGRFCVNILHADQGDLCYRFARSGEDRYDGIGWNPSPSGLPILAGVTGWIDCRIDSMTEVGDHLLVLGLVEQLDHAENVGDALVFFRGQVAGIDAQRRVRA